MRSGTVPSPIVLASITLVAIALSAVAAPGAARAQDADAGAPPAEPPPETAPEPAGPEATEGLATPARDEPDQLEAEREPEPEPLPVPPPDRRGTLDLEGDQQPAPPVEEGEPGIEAYEETLEPTLVLPEWRIRLGGGVSLATSGPSGVWGRATQEVEWLPPSLQFLSVGIGAAEMFGVGVTGQIGVRVGGYAWFCEDATVRCMGAITIQLGAIFGAIGPDFDFAADADLRFLFSQLIELHVRGGFFSVQMQSFVNITGGVGIAF